MRSRGFGTNIRRTPDAKRIAASVAAPGIDTRTWVTSAAVAVSGGGETSFTNPHAVLTEPAGVLVDVLLMPSGVPVTCRYYGSYGGKHGAISFPVAAGDNLLVLLPEGNPMALPVALPPMHSANFPMPVGDDGKPVFKNDRILIYGTAVPIEVRTKGGAIVRLDQDGNVDTDGAAARLGAEAATESLILGDTYREAEAEENTSLQAQLEAAAAGLTTAANASPFGPPPTPFSAVAAGLIAAAAALTAAAAAVGAFEARAQTFLSTYSKTK